MAVHQEISGGVRRRLGDERGMALLIALMAILLVMALGTALVLAASVESTITRNFRNSSEALYAADAGLERAVGDLKAIVLAKADASGAKGVCERLLKTVQVQAAQLAQEECTF